MAFTCAAALALAWLLPGWLRQRAAGPGDELLTVVDTRPERRLLLTERASTTDAAADVQAPRDPRLLREPMDLATAQLFFPPAGVNRPYNPRFFGANPPNLSRWIDFAEHPAGGFTMRTNSLGMCEDAEVLDTQPDLRILVVSDSHGSGLCENSETFTNRLEARLAQARPGLVVEALNASVGGYTFYHYLGVLEEYLELRPDVFVMGVYGGNDFGSMLPLQRYYHRRDPPVDSHWPADLTRSLKPKHIASQELNQVRYFRANPEDIEVAIETADAITLEVERLCRENGIAFLLLYIPPPFLSQGHWYRGDMAETLKRTGLTPAALTVSDRIANAWLARARERQVAILDLRPTFKEFPERLFNRELDCHVNVRGQDLIGELLERRVSELLERRPPR